MGGQGGRKQASEGSTAYLEALRRAYGSLSEPTRHFVNDVFQRHPFESIRRELSTDLTVADDTDVNCEVCFTYMVQCERFLVVRLSMAGPYAVLVTMGDDGFGPAKVVPSRDACIGDRERKVYDVVSSNGFKILSADELKREIDLPIAHESPTATLYSAFFSFEGDPPTE